MITRRSAMSPGWCKEIHLSPHSAVNSCFTYLLNKRAKGCQENQLTEKVKKLIKNTNNHKVAELVAVATNKTIKCIDLNFAGSLV